MSWRSRTIWLVMGAWGCAISPGWAKPPDLPAQQTIICAPPAAAKPGSNFQALPNDLLVTEEEQESLEPLDLICPCFWEVLRSYWQSWSLSLVEIYSGDASTVGRTMSPALSPESPLECPYLRQKSAQNGINQAETSSLPSSVLDNLDKLEQAQTLWRRAEDCRRQGDYSAAFACYTQIQKLCPGSSYDRMVTQQMNDLLARGLAPSATSETAEMQEAPPQLERPRQ